MLVNKCDICKKEIKDKAVFASVGSSFLLNQMTFCLKCGKPVADFVNKLNKKENGKQERKK